MKKSLIINLITSIIIGYACICFVAGNFNPFEIKETYRISIVFITLISFVILCMISGLKELDK